MLKKHYIKKIWRGKGGRQGEKKRDCLRGNRKGKRNPKWYSLPHQTYFWKYFYINICSKNVIMENLQRIKT
jgi:hypothetical protein